jgi:hypothetical protein
MLRTLYNFSSWCITSIYHRMILLWTTWATHRLVYSVQFSPLLSGTKKKSNNKCSLQSFTLKQMQNTSWQLKDLHGRSDKPILMTEKKCKLLSLSRFGKFLLLKVSWFCMPLLTFLNQVYWHFENTCNINGGGGFAVCIRHVTSLGLLNEEVYVVCTNETRNA